ncbi:MAG: cytidylate kinase-like family protein [Ruminococcaceae bacterium]|nr:cytidylate kinase-like family protein [Oscillospiraceae bacterium]
MKNNTVITIGRQYGSGGREIGKKISEILKIGYYDDELISLAAKNSGMSTDALSGVDEKATNSLLYTLAMGGSLFGGNAALAYEMPINDKLYIAQSDIIKDLANREECVIIGRCADYVLKEIPGVINVFIYADIETRAARVAARRNITEAKAKDIIIKTDKQRANYYNYYTSRKWGRIENYDLCIDSGKTGPQKAAEIIAEYVKAISQC